MSKQQVLVFGKPIEKMPADLYIPPEALRVLLESFEGPLDLLLYLIRKHKMDIFDVQVTLITQQYLAYIKMMKTLDITIAAEYLLMAATLADIKARVLLPVVIDEETQEDIDPRMELVDRLLLYAQMTKAADILSQLPRLDNGFALSAHHPPRESLPLIKPKAEVNNLKIAVMKLQAKQLLKKHHEVEQEQYSLSERIQIVRSRLHHENWQSINCFYEHSEGKAGLIITLMAILELDRSQILQWQQSYAFSDILLKAR